MEQILSNMIFSSLFLCHALFLWDIRKEGLLSFLFDHFQSLCISIFHCCNSWTSSRTVKPCSRTQNQSPNLVRLTKEEVIMVMGGLGLSVEPDLEGLDDEIGEQEVEALFEKEPSFKELKDVFDVFDENGDGFIEARELQRVLKCLGLEREIRECERMINAVDENGDGLIDRSVFVKFMEQRFDT